MDDDVRKCPVPSERAHALICEGTDAMVRGINEVAAVIESSEDAGKGLTQTATDLEATRKALADTNSSYPTTQEFLQERGLTHVDELDQEGRRALLRHLESTLSLLNLKVDGEPS